MNSPMMGAVFGAVFGAVVIVCTNVVLFSYYYGRVTQRVDDHERRISSLEQWRNTQ